MRRIFRFFKLHSHNSRLHEEYTKHVLLCAELHLSVCVRHTHGCRIGICRPGRSTYSECLFISADLWKTRHHCDHAWNRYSCSSAMSDGKFTTSPCGRDGVVVVGIINRQTSHIGRITIVHFVRSSTMQGKPDTCSWLKWCCLMITCVCGETTRNARHLVHPAPEQDSILMLWQTPILLPVMVSRSPTQSLESPVFERRVAWMARLPVTPASKQIKLTWRRTDLCLLASEMQ